MWLLDTTTLDLQAFIGKNIPPYAILSHVWGAEEVSFTDMNKAKNREAAKRKLGYRKIEGCCAQASRDGYQWAWVDSCCIDKRSSAELSEAINSMFEWYTKSGRCYVYLADVGSTPSPAQEFKRSRWYTRGWTLQELLAPQDTVFFDRAWAAIGQLRRHTAHVVPIYESTCNLRDDLVNPRFSYPDLTNEISAITDIPVSILTGSSSIFSACVAQRMYWASRRETTRLEDRVYSLMGIFNISMPILYGEGLERAFTRLQREIMSNSNDHSIFAWYRSGVVSYGLLAQSPDDFRNSGSVVINSLASQDRSSFSTTNIGLRITLKMLNNTGGTLRLTGAGARMVFNLTKGASVQVLLCCTVGQHDTTNDQAVSLDLTYVADDSEGTPIFFCNRPGELVLRPTKTKLVSRSIYIEY